MKTLSSCIAQAVNEEIDIVEACPEIQDVPTDRMNSFVDEFTSALQHEIEDSIEYQGGAMFLQDEDTWALVRHLKATCPSLRFARFSVLKRLVDKLFELYKAPDQIGLYLVRMDIPAEEIWPQK